MNEVIISIKDLADLLNIYVQEGYKYATLEYKENNEGRVTLFVNLYPRIENKDSKNLN